ncbi:MAG: 2-amino-4-hydroxy-6-hydroxymethyldihydropteridine diphosphokinase [Alphaproteobacteria bacterium]|nr:2-amino-4-hydroxy-6-hydroxymethyldihydropteridine diphosphokinase [Alphaproteobacteria bacterium]
MAIVARSNSLVAGPILVGVGANLPSAFGSPIETCAAALTALASRGLAVVRRSPWYRTAPVPMSDQHWFINGVVEVAGSLDPVGILAILHGVESAFGRVRDRPNEDRVIDLDLLAFGALIRQTAPVLPHPRMARRAFVLLPLRDLEPGWTHPALGPLAGLIAALPPGQTCLRASEHDI